MAIRGIRGATTVKKNDRKSILAKTKELLIALQEANSFDTKDIASIFFSMTRDLNAAFPAAAARQLGWQKVPLFGVQEADIVDTDGLKRCIRILVQINTEKSQDEINHCYLHEAMKLRKDLTNKKEIKNDCCNGW